MTCTDVGRANSNIPELTASSAAAIKVLQLIDRISEIDPDDETGDQPVSCYGERSECDFEKICQSLVYGSVKSGNLDNNSSLNMHTKLS